MKTIFLLLTIVISLPQMTYGQQSNLARPIVYERDASQDFGDWVEHGKLIYQWTDTTAGQVGWYIYKSHSGAAFILSGRLDGMNQLISDEIAQTAVNNFLSQKMAAFLVDIGAATPSNIISERFVLNFRSTKPDTASKLQHYAADPVLKLAGNSWALDFNIATVQGGIERWIANGSITPMSVRMLSREIVQPSGYFSPLSLTGFDK